MKQVLLFVPRVIAGAVRYPVEGVINASDAEAEQILADKAGELATEGDDEEEGEKPLAKQTTAELNATASSEEIDLKAAKNNHERVLVIQTTREARLALDGKTEAELTKLAEDEKVDLGEANERDDIIAALIADAVKGRLADDRKA